MVLSSENKYRRMIYKNTYDHSNCPHSIDLSQSQLFKIKLINCHRYSFASSPFSIYSIWKDWFEETCGTSHLIFSLYKCFFYFLLSLKCDLNPVFRRKGALLWPPLHPSPHFHPPCLGRRKKVLKRLSTSSLGPHRVERSKSSWSTLPFLPLPPPSRSSVLHMLLLMCPAAWANPPPASLTIRYLPSSASSSLCS